MNTYTWKFPALDAHSQQDGLVKPVYNVHWRLIADDGAGHTAEIYGVQACGPVDSGDFTAFEDLTEAQVQGWVEAEMGLETVSAMKLSLDAQIEMKANPTKLTLTPPWATNHIEEAA